MAVSFFIYYVVQFKKSFWHLLSMLASKQLLSLSSRPYLSYNVLFTRVDSTRGRRASPSGNFATLRTARAESKSDFKLSGLFARAKIGSGEGVVE